MNSDSYGQKTASTEKNHERIFLRSGINRFPERLKEAMSKAGISSNVQLGRQTELSEATIRKYLKGETYPTLDRLALIAEACSCSMAWFLTGEDDGQNKTIEINEGFVYNCSAQGAELDRILSYLTVEQREKFMKVLYTKGTAAILRLDDDLDSQFLSLTEDEKTRLLRLNEQVKKGASIPSEEDNLTDPTHKRADSA